MGAILYCPACEGIVTGDADRCVVCGHDLRADQPLLEPPSYYRDRALLAAELEAAEPSKALGVMAWIAQVLGTIWFILFCIAPVVLIVVVIFLLMIASGTRG